MSFSIDYFAVLGKKNGVLTSEKVRSLWDDSQQVSLRDVWNDAITDIAVVTEYNVDSIDDSWQVIRSSFEGRNFSDYGMKITIAVQRRRESKRLDHISQVIASGDVTISPIVTHDDALLPYCLRHCR